MAGVWEAYDELLGRPVAVKVLASHLAEDDRARRRFEREARAAAGLSSHQHVVTIYDVGEHDGRVFMVMELMRGGTVGERLKEGRAIADETALRWLREAASALDAAHDGGHRASRHQARQPAARRPRPARDRRLRHRADRARGPADGDRPGAGHGVVHLARAGGRHAGQCGVRPLRAGRRRLRAADRLAPLPGRALRRPGARPRRGPAAAGDRARPVAAARRGRRARPRAGQGSGRALAERERHGRGARPRDGLLAATDRADAPGRGSDAWFVG